ncbi:hypothetical protein EV361DRAFT_633154 [Lentinula raphanica]|nr:hypothetical protein EV361DRAFT_633154 [Lentinula raphanica]
MTILDMRTVSVALLLLANALGITAAPLLSTGQNVTAAPFSITSQNATEQDLIKRVNNRPIRIYAKRILTTDKGTKMKPGRYYPHEHSLITLGQQHGLKLVPAPWTLSSPLGRRGTIDQGSWWLIEPTQITGISARRVTTSYNYILLGTLRFNDYVMRQVLFGPNALGDLEKQPIHSPLQSQGKSSADPTPQMYLDAADAMVKRLRTLDAFYEKLLLEEDIGALDARLRAEEEQKKGGTNDDRRARLTSRQEGGEEEEPKPVRRAEFIEEKVSRTGTTAWDAYVIALKKLWARIESLNAQARAQAQASSSKP